MGVIGGSCLWGAEKDLLAYVRQKKKKYRTPYGEIEMYSCSLGDKKFLFIPFHGIEKWEEVDIAFQRVFHVFKENKVRKVVSCGTAGGIDPSLDVGDVVVVDDFLDFTVIRARYLQPPSFELIRMKQALCPYLRGILFAEASQLFDKVVDRGVYVCTEGPRFETPAEIRMFKTLGGDIVAMTLVPEVVLARQIDACYAGFYLVSNPAEGVRDWESESFGEVVKRYNKKCVELLLKAIPRIDERYSECECQKYHSNYQPRGSPCTG